MGILIDLTSLTALYELNDWQLSSLTDEEVESLKTLFYDLAECCDRGQEGTLAYHISVQELEGDAWDRAIQQTEQLLMEFEMIE